MFNPRCCWFVMVVSLCSAASLFCGVLVCLGACLGFKKKKGRSTVFRDGVESGWRQLCCLVSEAWVVLAWWQLCSLGFYCRSDLVVLLLLCFPQTMISSCSLFP
ncbi:hypothetical protein Dsin_017124 [Dipteronia sinensis]|uniref:Secreted protein n=1 Tax=Dipteronia sinensis TaxID=43782 RepID=A0AAE0AF68_9ROSI|nr:hypothetical protein Dsin_017124 [Dipteronia sinensis]